MIVKTFYSYTEQSISWSGGWTEKRYILCETDEEYQKCLSLIEQEIADFTKRGYASRISAKIDTEISAREYFVHGCGWTGKVFDAKGSILCKALECSNEYTYFIRPNTLVEQKKPVRKVSFMDTLTDS